MAEKDIKPPTEDWSEKQNGQPDDFIPKDAQPLCPNCLKPCDPLTNYCPNCSSNEVINPFASYMPIESIRFGYGFFGKAWYKIWYDKQTPTWLRLVCLITTVLVAPILFIAGMPLVVGRMIPQPNIRRVTVAVLYLLAIGLLLLLVLL